MVGVSLLEQGYTTDPVPVQTSVKESVFPFVKFAGIDIVLGPEMKSTGEVMGVAEEFPIAFAKSQIAAGTLLPRQGRIFVSMNDRSKAQFVPLARRLAAMGFELLATTGTARCLEAAGINVRRVKKLQEGHPNLIDYMLNGEVQLVFNTPSGKGARTDEGRIRAAAVARGVPCVTTLQAAEAAVSAMEALRRTTLSVQALQDRLPQYARR